MIETKRLILRHLEKYDLPALTELLGDAEVMRFSADGSLDAAEAATWLVEQINVYTRENGLGLFAIARKMDSAFIGYCGLAEMTDIEGRSELEVGYRLARSAWGNGYATEAASAIREGPAAHQPTSGRPSA